MAAQKNEIVSVSFHYLRRQKTVEKEDPIDIPFSEQDFEALFVKMKSKPIMNLREEAIAELVRRRLEVPLENIQRVDTRTIAGTFRGSYWGHAYDNTAKGHIPADSISLRPFHFLLYLSESGRIYIATQYLGPFGGYVGLQRTICSLLPDSKSIFSHSFRSDESSYRNAVPQEVRVEFSNRPKSISSANSFTRRGMIAFKKSGQGDNFEESVAKRLLPFLGRPKDEIRKAVAKILSESDLLEVRDQDIEDCSVVALVNGRKKTIYMLEGSGFASRYPIDVPVNSDGHPEFGPTKAAMLEMLEQMIISRREDV